MTQPRTGTSRCAPTETMVAALPTCSASNPSTAAHPPEGGATTTPAPGDVVAVHAAATPPTTTTPHRAQANTTPRTAAMTPPRALVVIAAPRGHTPPSAHQPGGRIAAWPRSRPPTAAPQCPRCAPAGHGPDPAAGSR